MSNPMNPSGKNPVNDYLELSSLIYYISLTGQPCDIVFFDKKPLYNIRVSPGYAEKINKLLLNGCQKEFIDKKTLVDIDNQEQIDSRDIWCVVPLPFKPFTENQLLSVDVSKKNDLLPSGETLMEFISTAYQTNSDEETDYFLRRYLATQAQI